jgi:hypothetical protein
MFEKGTTMTTTKLGALGAATTKIDLAVGLIFCAIFFMLVAVVMDIDRKIKSAHKALMVSKSNEAQLVNYIRSKQGPTDLANGQAIFAAAQDPCIRKRINTQFDGRLPVSNDMLRAFESGCKQN